MNRTSARRLLPGLLAVGLLFALAGLWQPHDVDAIDLANRHGLPGWTHILGTDHLGRDMFSRLLVGAWNTAVVLVVVTGVSFTLGIVVGTTAALAGGLVGATLLRLADFVVIVPQLVLALFLTALFGLSPLTAGLALGLGGWGSYAILAHGLARRIMAQPYYLAAEALGSRPAAAATRHLLPNIMDAVLTYMASDAGRHVISYAALAFLGLGADTSRPDWGAMLFEYRIFLIDNPLLMLWPGLAIFATALAFHLAVEPRRRRWPRAAAPRAAARPHVQPALGGDD